MDVTIRPCRPHGEVSLPPSKSEMHRALICAAFSDETTVFHRFENCLDLSRTIGCLTSLGVTFEYDEDELTVYPVSPDYLLKMPPTFDCGESGTTLRLLLPVTSAFTEAGTFKGTGRLPQRPISPELEEIARHGVSFSSDHLPVTFRGRMKGGAYTVPASETSQFVSGFLLASPLTGSDCRVRLASSPVSRPYMEMTCAVMEKFGVTPEKTEDGWFVGRGKGYLSPRRYTPEYDWSNAAFWYCAKELGWHLSLPPLNPDSMQADAAVMRFVGQMKERGEVVLDLSDSPDLFPILAVFAASRRGRTVFTSVSRLRKKESDRVESVEKLMRSLEGRAELFCRNGTEDFIVYGGGLKKGKVDACGDHRIVMAAFLASILTGGDVTVLGAEAVAKSDRLFFERFTKIGGKYDASWE